jgi:hypothetical protein
MIIRRNVLQRFKYLLILPILIGSCSPNKLLTTNQVIADGNYLVECRNNYRDANNVQKCYMNICPGVTSKNELDNLFLKPININGFKNATYYIYDKYTILMIDEIVENINIINDEAYIRKFSELLEDYGCPNLILAEDPDEEPAGNYQIVDIIYTLSGFSLKFAGYPISLESIPEQITLFQAVDLKRYLDSSPYLNDIDFARISDWDDAIK